MKLPTLFKINIIRDFKKKNRQCVIKGHFRKPCVVSNIFLSPPSFNLAINFKDTYDSKILEEIQKSAMNDLLYK